MSPDGTARRRERVRNKARAIDKQIDATVLFTAQGRREERAFKRAEDVFDFLQLVALLPDAGIQISWGRTPVDLVSQLDGLVREWGEVAGSERNTADPVSEAAPQSSEGTAGPTEPPAPAEVEIDAHTPEVRSAVGTPVQIDACISRVEEKGRQRYVFSNEIALIRTLVAWKRAGTRDIWLTWGATPEDVVRRVEKLIRAAGVTFAIPGAKRSSLPPTGTRRSMRRFLGSIYKAIGTGIAVLGAVFVYSAMRPNQPDRGEIVRREAREIADNRTLSKQEKLDRLNRLERELLEDADRSFNVRLVGITAGGLLGVGGVALRRYGRKLTAPTADELERNDPRPPVLLLRSFTDDRAGYTSETRPVGGLDVGLYSANSREWISFEEMLAEQFGRYGPVVAIGCPGENLPPLGAARMYFDNDAWQTGVTDYLRWCQFVVMIVGVVKGNDGLAWELRQVFTADVLGKLILVMPPVAETEAQDRWTEFQKRSAGQLPAYEGGELVAGFGADSRCVVIRIPGRRNRFDGQYVQAIEDLVRNIRVDVPATCSAPVLPPLNGDTFVGNV